MPTNNNQVVIRRSTNECVLETGNKEILKRINTKKYKIVPIYEYLQSLGIRNKANDFK